MWDIYLSTSADGTQWSFPLRISDPNVDDQVSPAIAVTGSSPNTVFVAWQDDRGGSQDIYVASSSTLFASQTLAQVTSHASDQTGPVMAVGASNTVYLAWTDRRNGTADVYGASSGSSWAETPIVTGSGNQSSPALAIESGESVCHWLWVDDAPGYADIYYAQSNGLPATAMSGSSILDETNTNPSYPEIIAGIGRVFACWADDRSASDGDLYFAEIRSSAAGTNVLVGDDGANSNQIEPVLGLDAQGEPFVVWTDDRGSHTEIYGAGTNFVDAQPLHASTIVASQGGVVGTAPQSITSVGDASVVVPAGALKNDLMITIAEIHNPPAFASEQLSAFDFGPSGIQFNEPVTITIPYEFSDTASQAQVFWFSSQTDALSEQGITDVQDITISATLHALRFKTTHFTPFYILRGSPGGGGGGGGGCSLSHAKGVGMGEFFIPYGVLAVFLFFSKWKSRRASK